MAISINAWCLESLQQIVCRHAVINSAGEVARDQLVVGRVRRPVPAVLCAFHCAPEVVACPAMKMRWLQDLKELVAAYRPTVLEVPLCGLTWADDDPNGIAFEASSESLSCFSHLLRDLLGFELSALAFAPSRHVVACP